MPKRNKKGAHMEFYGSSDLIKKLEALGGNAEQAVVKALKAGAKKPYDEMRSYAEQHKLTGDTLRSLEMQEPIVKDGVVKMKVGFVVKKEVFQRCS